jgi:hypothetical protein
MVRSVALSSDGRSVYAGSFSDSAVVRFKRNRRTGRIAPGGCIADDTSFGDDSCAGDANALFVVTSVTVSPDDRSVYATSANDDALVHFRRASRTGRLRLSSCVTDRPGVCPRDGDALDFMAGALASPDGDWVYGVSDGDNALTRFKLRRR